MSNLKNKTNVEAMNCGTTNRPVYSSLLGLVILFGMVMGAAFSGCAHETSPNPFTDVVRAQSYQSCDACQGDCIDCPDCGNGRICDTGGQFENEITGRQIFLMNCSSCHEGRSIIERPLAQTAVSFSHARKHAYLTGGEYRKLVNFLRQWHGLAHNTVQ